MNVLDLLPDVVSSAEHTELVIGFGEKGEDASEDVLPDLLSFSYVDKENGEADELSLTLKDETGKWAGRWKPEHGETVIAWIRKLNRRMPALFCGKFFVDSLRVSGSPRVFELRATSVPLNTPIRRKANTKGWEKTNIKAIAEEICKEAKVSLLFDSQENPTYDRRDQKAESNLKFLSSLCEEAGLSLKVTDKQIVIFDQSFYEKQKPVASLTLEQDQILSWSFESQRSETYKSCTVSWRDPKKKTKKTAGGYNVDLQKEGSTSTEYDKDLRPIQKNRAKTNSAVHTFTYNDPEIDESGQEYVLKKRCANADEAKQLAKATLRKLNQRSLTGSLTIVGNTNFVAGIVIELKGFGSFDGNFFVEQAEHSVTSGGYVTNLSVRRTNTNY